MRMAVDIRKIAFAIVLLIGLSQCARVYGLSEYGIAIVETLTYISVVIIAAIIIWYLYKFLMIEILDWLDDSITDGKKSGLFPLFSVMGTLVISISAVWMILSHLGIDLLVILTSAGIVGLAVTFGAQSTLSQFFSGLNILVSRPFKVGDVIRLDGSNVTYRVRKIGLMNSILEEWESTESYSFPNNKLSGAVVNNVTGEQKAFCAMIILDIHYKSDLGRAKELMIQAAENTEHIILDDTKPYPNVTFIDLNTTHVKAKLSAYGNDFEHNGKIISDLIEKMVILLRDNNVGYSPPKYEIRMCDE